MNLLLPESGLLFWMTIIFAIVFFILARFGFPVITGMVEKRSKRINDSLEAARIAEEALEHLSQEKERILSDTKVEQEKLMKEAAAERDRMILQAQNQARAEADKIMSEAREQIRQEKEAALRDIRKEVAIVSMAIAEKVVRKDLSSEKKKKKLLDTLVNEMKELQ